MGTRLHVVYTRAFSNMWVPMQPGQAALGSGKRAGMITRNAYTQGKGQLAWDTWPNRLVLRLSLQSANETNDSLKSGPAKAGPAGLAMPPLYIYLRYTCYRLILSLRPLPDFISQLWLRNKIWEWPGNEATTGYVPNVRG